MTRFPRVDQSPAAALEGAEQAIRNALTSTNADLKEETLYRLNNDTSPENIRALAKSMLKELHFTIGRVAEAIDRKGGPLTAEEMRRVYSNSKS